MAAGRARVGGRSVTPQLTMSEEQPNNPLHGLTLKAVVEDLVARYGWYELGERIQIRCFTQNPTINSSLKFLRKTQWARDEVEALYVEDQRMIERNRKRNQRRAQMRADRTEDEPQSESPGDDA